MADSLGNFPDRVNSSLSNPAVAQLGFCSPGWEQDNIKKYGWACPRDHFIYGPRDITSSEVARIWGLTAEIVGRWRREHGWESAKKDFLARQPADLGGDLETPDIQDLQREVLGRQLRDLNELADMGMERARAAYEEVNTATEVTQRKKSDASFARISQEVRAIHADLRVAAGLHTKMTGISGGGPDTRQITVITVNRPNGAFDPIAALGEGDIIDAEPEGSDAQAE